jgi:hypothetical protein
VCNKIGAPPDMTKVLQAAKSELESVCQRPSLLMVTTIR